MSRITEKFDQLAKQGRKALIPFITAGDPNPEFTVPMMHAMVEAGSDILELGVPFSDPMADGPVIQRASERALTHHVGLRKVLTLVQEFRKKDNQTPIVLMGYLNPIEIWGGKAFSIAAQEAGVDALITVDLPPEESINYVECFKENNIDQIYLLAPNTPPQRIKKINALANGYLYYVSLKGITGAGHLDLDDVKNKLAIIYENTELPVVVGFGIKNAETAKAISKLADGVVVGSAIISKVEDNLDNPEKAKAEIIDLLKSMRLAMDDER